MFSVLPSNFVSLFLSEWIPLKELVLVDLYITKGTESCKNGFCRNVKAINYPCNNGNKSKLFKYLFPMCSSLEDLNFGVALKLVLSETEIRSIGTLFTHLKSLSLRNQTKLTDEVMVGLVNSCPCLCELDVSDYKNSNCKISDATIALLFATRPVKALHVAGNSVLTYSFVDTVKSFNLLEFSASSHLSKDHLLKITKTSPCLQKLSLYECGWTVSCDVFVEVCINCPNLVVFDAEQHLISDFVLERMSLNCPKLTHLFCYWICTGASIKEIPRKFETIRCGFPSLQFISFDVKEHHFAERLHTLRPSLTILKKREEYSNGDVERKPYFTARQLQALDAPDAPSREHRKIWRLK